MVQCSAYNCTRTDRDGSGFPLKSIKMCKIWVARAKRSRDFIPTKNSYMCGVHFLASDWEEKEGKRRLKKGAIPLPVNVDHKYHKQNQTGDKTEGSNWRRLAKRKIDDNHPSLNVIAANEEEQNESKIDDQQCDGRSRAKVRKSMHSKRNTSVGRRSPKDNFFESSTPAGKGINEDQLSAGIHDKGDLEDVLDVVVEVAKYSESTGMPYNDASCDNSNDDVIVMDKSYSSMAMELEKKTNVEALEERLAAVEAENQRLKAVSLAYDNVRKNAAGILNGQQFKVLEKAEPAQNTEQSKTSKKRNRPKEWSNDTIMRAIKLRFVCGTTGYESMLEDGYPGPTIRTLQARTEHIQCNAGLEDITLDIVKVKLDSLKDEEDKDFILYNDEMKITPGKQYDSAAQRVIGNSTLHPHENEIGDKGMVWLLAGLRRRVKITVANHITAKKVNATSFRVATEEVIVKTEKKTGAKIKGFCTDMAPLNMALWKEYGIRADRTGLVVCETTHPADPRRKLLVFADSPHLGKNTKAALEKHGVFFLSPKIVKKYKLPSNEVKYSHLEALQALEKNDDLKLAPKLARVELRPNNFQQMRVKNSSWVLSESCAAALSFMAEDLNDPSLVTTAWFLENYHGWYEILNSTTPSKGMTRKNFEEKKAFLMDFMEIIRGTFVGKCWKPFQRGMLVTTTAFIKLSKSLLQRENYLFVLGCHMNSNCIENLFSVIRRISKVPTALQFKHALKSIFLSQYFKVARGSNYETDLGTLLSDVLDVTRRKSIKKETSPESSVLVVSNAPMHFSNRELNILYYISGYLVDSTLTNQRFCQACTLGLTVEPFVASFTSFLRRKENTEGVLTYISADLFSWFTTLEVVFLNSRDKLLNVCNPLEQLCRYGVDKMKHKMIFKNCHGIEEKLVKRFFSFRLKVSADQLSRKMKVNVAPMAMGSQTAGSKAYADNPLSGKGGHKSCN